MAEHRPESEPLSARLARARKKPKHFWYWSAFDAKWGLGLMPLGLVFAGIQLAEPILGHTATTICAMSLIPLYFIAYVVVTNRKLTGR